ncbi:uncharacterized protein K444DRAFT_703282 [Hyaloscypha bicolor E]|uniref:Putative 5'-nucleotidase C-terminal domain-containing protein n=1 Tax=Hyaloscypha bicolor E TaxID=1095630 RepID=A0A2J6TR32_9HELO|nr:uncharacterized protein K444DRAFT_703282 [Hyaloscypha bicolor E]PMD65487.1 hypothetical protein K444DRAFT_703282 [Hyaloscypha bicolor E]
MRASTLFNFAAAVSLAVACDSCYGPSSEVIHERLVRRMQPEAQDTTIGPKAPLEWGQLNFMHTTDTHGWLEGHLKEQNYGADWGDFVSFSTHMKHKAGNLGVDLLLVDTGDLHDGNGLSDAALPNGVYSNPIFDEVDYDLLTIGNHELYVAEVAYEQRKYVTSNVQIVNPATSQFEYIGKQYRYFKTEHGLRIMAFGVLYDFTGNSNVSKVIKAVTLVQQQWFLDAINYPEPIDLFLVIGHNPIRTTDFASTFSLLHNTIRALRPNVPIQAFGGHSHIRDFQVYDDMSTGLESGRYCETLGWVSMSGIKSSSYTGVMKPHGVTNPSRLAMNTSTTFDYHSGLRVTGEITDARKELNLALLYGCAPQTWCASCQPFESSGNIFSLVSTALGAVVVNSSRSTIPRIVIVNTGSIRFDLVKGPFTFDDSFIVSPFTDAFQYINVPYALAKNVLNSLNGAPLNDKRNSAGSDWGYVMPQVKDSCMDPIIGFITEEKGELKARGHTRRQTVVIPGYTTKDDFGTDGDDTPHSKIPSYSQPNYAAGNASFPTDGTTPATVDVVFLDFFASTVVSVLNKLGGTYTTANVQYYMPPTYTSQNYLPEYAKKYWQANVPNCPVGQGVGFPSKN